MYLTDQSSITELIKEMTLEEKLTLLSGASQFNGTALEKYGIPAVSYLDGGTGINTMQILQEIYEKLSESEKKEPVFQDFIAKIPTLLTLIEDQEKVQSLTDPQLVELFHRVKELMEPYVPEGKLPGCFPPGIVLASGWNPETIYQCGRALGKEAQYYKIDVLLGTPNINIHRDPRGGRLFEGYSEDPCLVAKLAPAFVRGIQDEGVIANTKHFIANNQETERMTVNERIPERALQEIYLPGFKACVKEGGCKTVMSAYNAVNGQHCVENPWLLTELLKEEWGFDGYVMSDWGAAYNQVTALKAGNDMAMPGPRDTKPMIEAVENGTLSEDSINESIRRYLSTLLLMPVMKGRRYKELNRECSAQAAYEAVKESIILLKNREKTLPLSKNAGVAFYGEKSKRFIESGGGSANVVTSESTSLYETMREMLGEEMVSFERITKTTDTVIITVGVIGREGADRANLKLPHEEQKLLSWAISEAKKEGKKVVVILNVCGPVELTEYEEDIDALLCIFIPGMEGGHAVADALVGNFSPSGKLPITFPRAYRDTPTYGNFPGRNSEVWYGEGTMVGYRYYEFKEIEPMFPFGFGLSYTSFQIENVRTNKQILDKDRKEDTIILTFTIRNTGTMTGKEVIQLYVGEENPILVKPPKELKDFMKVELEPGQSKELSFTITADELASYDEITGSWQVQPDDYVLYLGTSSRHIVNQIKITAEGNNPYGITEDTLLGHIAGIEGAIECLAKYCPEGVVNKEGIELQTLGDIVTTLKMYWEATVKDKLELSEEEKEVQYRKMLQAMNQFCI